MIIQTPASRSTDPDSSHIAEFDLNKSGTRRRQIAQVADAVEKHPGRTSRELAVESGFDRHMVARRLPEAETAGLVEKGDMRKCSSGNRQAVTWWPSAQESAA